MNEAITYSGWSNKETWVANLWLNNDVQLYAHLIAAKRAGRTEAVQAELLERSMQTSLELRHLADESSVWTDLLMTAFNRIDWSEVARNN